MLKLDKLLSKQNLAILAAAALVAPAVLPGLLRGSANLLEDAENKFRGIVGLKPSLGAIHMGMMHNPQRMGMMHNPGHMGLMHNPGHMGALHVGGAHMGALQVNPGHMGAVQVNPGHMGALAIRS